MRPRRYYRLPGGATSLDGLKFDWVHIFSRLVPPLGAGSINSLMWTQVQQHYPDHLLIARYHPENLVRARAEKAAIVYLEYRLRTRFLDRMRQRLAGIPTTDARDFIDEACRCIASIDVPNILVRGGPWPLPYLRRAFPDRTIVYAQHYYEIARTFPRNYEYCDYLITLTEGAVRFTFEREPATHPVAFAIPDGIDVHRFRPAPEVEKGDLRDRLGLPQDKTVVIFPSKIDRDKGTSYLFNWIQECRRLLPQVYFVVAGPLVDAPRGDTRFLVELLRQSDNGRWLGGVSPEEMPAWYQAADVSIMPGVWREGMSMAAAESLASGLPVVATRRGGLQEIVTHGYNGWLCRPEALFQDGLEALKTLAGDPELRRRLSANARAYAETRLSLQRWLDNYRALFEGRLLDIDGDLTPLAETSVFSEMVGARIGGEAPYGE